MALKKLETELLSRKNKEKSKILSRYFKTGKGEYGEGDIFLGITVVEQRKIVKNYFSYTLAELENLLNSNIHEFRFCALLILLEKYNKADNLNKKKLFNFYLKNLKNINNWDLVDVSCHKIIGNYLFDKDRDLLYKLAKSKNIWEKRISLISTLYFIKKGDLKDVYNLAQILINDKHDLIQKALGWMLREAGKINKALLEDFLEENINKISRVSLRYSIEKFSEKERIYYLKK